MTRNHLLTLTAAILLSSSAAFADTAPSAPPKAVPENEATMAALVGQASAQKSVNNDRPGSDAKPISVWGAKLDLSSRNSALDQLGCWGTHDAR